MNLIQSKKIGFIGAGNMTEAIIEQITKSGQISKDKIYVASRSENKLDKLIEKFQVNKCTSNEDLVDNCQTVFLATKPQDLLEAVEPIAMSFDDSQVVVSIAAGITMAQLKKTLSEVRHIVRIIPNTPSKIGRGIVGYYYDDESDIIADDVLEILSPLGQIIKAEDEEQLRALSVATSSGPAFIFELMQYWVDWLEDYGFLPETAKLMTVETFLGASMLASGDPDKGLEVLQSQVTSKKGITYAGLTAMREEEIERLLRVSFEKAMIRDKKLSEEFG